MQASLRGRALRVRGRTITVDLRDQPVGNYNIKLSSRYRTRTGNVRKVLTVRNLSVACG